MSKPQAPRKPCSFPGCPELVDQGRCAKHRSRRQRELRKDHFWRDYGARWRRIRDRVLLREPVCRRCGAPATEVDHIVPLRFTRSHLEHNLQPLCKSCHSSKTARETGFGGDHG